MKIFISDIDSYMGAPIAAAFKKDHPAAVIIGSSRESKEISVGSPAAIPAALDADIIVLNLVSALIEAQAVTEALREYIAALPSQERGEEEERGEEGSGEEGGDKNISKTIIALSSALCWDRTTSIPQPFDESVYKRRRPGMKTAEVRDTEIAVMALARPDKGVRAHVVAAGLPYGGGWGPLYSLMRRAWLCIDNASVAVGAAQQVGLPVPCMRDDRGKNKLPTIHVRDLAAFVGKVAAASAELQPEVSQGEYFVAVDESADTLLDICGAISRTLGAGGTRLLTKEQAGVFFSQPYDIEYPASSTPTPPQRSHIGNDTRLLETQLIHLSAAINFDTATCAIFSDGRVSLGDDIWHCRGGIAAHIETVCAEFTREHDLRPLRLLVAGPPSVGKSRVSMALGIKYHVPVISAKDAIDVIRTGNLRAFSDGSAERTAALTALRDAVEKVIVDHDAATNAASAAAEKAKKKDKKPGKEEPETTENRGYRLPRSLMTRVIRALLLSPECRNKGWVLDGIPRTWAETDALFEAIPEGEDGITPADDGDVAVAKEEAEEDASVVQEANSKHVSITVLGHNLTSAVAAPQEEEGEAEEADTEDSSLPKKDAEPRLKPTAAIFLDAADAWLEARALASGATNKERFTRRLRRARLHHHPALTRTPLGWLETNARVDTCELRMDSALSALSSGAVDAAADDDDAAAGDGGVGRAVALARKFAGADADEDARIATLVHLDHKGVVQAGLSAYFDLSPESMVPADLSGDASHNALLDLAVLKYCATYAHKGGRPNSFHPFDEESAALESALRERVALKRSVIAEVRRSEEVEEQAIRQNNADIQGEQAAAARRAEAVLLEGRTAPLRAYLLDQVIPHITAGLVEVCKAGPVDPVDYLADYLLKIATEQEKSVEVSANPSKRK